MDIKDKKAIVFGGTSGIGLATCRALNAGGANVIALSRDPDKVETLVDSIRLGAVDATDGEAVGAFFDSEVEIDILISSATGGSRAFGPFLEMDIGGFKG